MAKTAALRDMRLEVRRFADLEHDEHVSDPEIARALNLRLSATYDLLIESRGQDYFRKAQTIPIVGNVDTYALANDFYKVISVDFTIGTNIVRSARMFTEAERNRYKWLPGWNFSTEVFYRISAGNVAFIPMPTGTFTVTLNYVPAYVDLVDDADAFNGVNGWEGHGIWAVVADLLHKQERDPSYALAQVAAWEARIRALAPQDLGEPERVQRVKRRGDGWRW